MRKLSRRVGAGEGSKGCLLRRLTRQLETLVATPICLCINLATVIYLCINLATFIGLCVSLATGNSLCLNMASCMAVSRSWTRMTPQDTGAPSKLSPAPLHLRLVRHLMNVQSSGPEFNARPRAWDLRVSLMRLSLRKLGLY